MTGAHTASASWRYTPEQESAAWAWPIDVAHYDRTATLTPAEQRELALLASRHGRQGHWPARTVQELARLRTPILDTLRATSADDTTRWSVLTVLAREMHRRGRAFWAWPEAEWSEILCPSGRAFGAAGPTSSLSPIWLGRRRTWRTLARSTASPWRARSSADRPSTRRSGGW